MQLHGLWVLNKHGSVQECYFCISAFDPGSIHQPLKLQQRLCESIVRFDCFLAFFRRNQRLVGCKLAHGTLHALQKRSRPLNGASNRRSSPRHGRLIFMFFIVLLHCFHIASEALKGSKVHGIHLGSDNVSRQERSMLAKQAKRMLSGDGSIK